MSEYGVLRIVRSVRRIARAAEGHGGGGVGLERAGAMLGLGAGPAGIALFGAALAVRELQQFAQPLGPGGINELVLPTLDEVLRRQDYNDRIRHITLQRTFGTVEGDKVWDAEWSQRGIDIDLRVRAP